jgi:uncharacterized protein
MTETWPSRMDHDTSAYWLGLRDGKLLLCRCNQCGTWIHPPRAACPSCWSDDIGHEMPSGKASLFSYLVQSTEPGQPVEVIGWAELVEQRELFVVAPVEGMSLDNVQIGADLILGFRKSRGTNVPVFHARGAT